LEGADQSLGCNSQIDGCRFGLAPARLVGRKAGEPIVHRIGKRVDGLRLRLEGRRLDERGAERTHGAE
jgi:hypothetical protein